MNDDTDYMIVDRDSDVLMISFGGLHEGFNFVTLGERNQFDCMFLPGRGGRMVCARCPRGWPQTQPEWVDSFATSCGAGLAGESLCIGSSSGGYGALRFALEIEPDACLAFSPQTRPVPADHRPIREFQTAKVSRPDVDIDDLGELYRARQPSFRAQVHVCQSEVDNPPEAYYWDDWFHVGGLHDVACVEIVTHPCSYHPVAYHLVDDLDEIVTSVLM